MVARRAQHEGRRRPAAVRDPCRCRGAVGEGRASRVEPAATRDPGRVGHLALEHHGRELLDLRHDREEGPGVGVLRRLEDLLGRAALHDPAEVHHGDPVGDVPRQAHVVGDHDDPEPERLAKAQQQRQDLAADRGVQRRDRLVGDQQPRPQRQRAGDQHPLLLPAGQLVRVAQEDPLGRAEARLGERGGHQLRLGAALGVAGHPPVQPDALGHGLVDGLPRVERAVRRPAGPSAPRS